MKQLIPLLFAVVACGPVEFPVKLGVDPAFIEKEACLIHEAARRWEEAAPGLVEIELIRGTPQEAGIIRCDGACGADDGPTALGYCNLVGGGNIWIHADRLRRFEQRACVNAKYCGGYSEFFTFVVMHEMGHHFGLEHHSRRGVLRFEADFNSTPCVSESDLRELSTIYGGSFIAPVCRPLGSACEGLSE